MDVELTVLFERSNATGAAEWGLGWPTDAIAARPALAETANRAGGSR